MSLKPPSSVREAFIVKSIHVAWFLQDKDRTYGAKKEKFVQICSNSKGFLKLCRTGNKYCFAIDQVVTSGNLKTAERRFGKEELLRVGGYYFAPTGGDYGRGFTSGQHAATRDQQQCG